jgi:alkylhydroperoxidase family enzyme
MSLLKFTDVEFVPIGTEQTSKTDIMTNSIFTRSPEKDAFRDDIIQRLDFRKQFEAPNWVTYLVEESPRFKGVWQLVKTGIFENGLPTLLKVLVMLNVARVQKSLYCEAQSLAIAIKITNLSLDELDDLLEGKSNGFVPERYSRAIQIAGDMMTSNCSNTADYKAKFLGSGFDSEDYFMLCELLGTCQYVTTFTKGFEIPIESDVRRFLAEHGATQFLNS